MFLLTDGSVLVHHAYGKAWYRLTPDTQGNYETGTWSAAINMVNTRQFFASGILRDGRVFAIGGEYSDAGDTGAGTALGEIFDPVADNGRGAWSALDKPAAFNWINKDATSCILGDGRVIFGDVNSNRTAIWDPGADHWREAGTGFGTRAASKHGSRYGRRDLDPAAGPRQQCPHRPGRWCPGGREVRARNRPVDGQRQHAVHAPTRQPQRSRHAGRREHQRDRPALLLPNGTVFCIGGTGHTAIYTPPGSPTGAGAWSPGPSFPADTSGNSYNQVNGNAQTAIDAPAVLLPNGKVLCIAGNTVREVSNGQVEFWSNPCTAYTYDPATNAFAAALVPDPPDNGVDTWQARLLLLPNGKVLFSSQQNTLAILTLDPATAAPNAAWKPVITNAPSSMITGHTYVISGKQINGLSQAVSYGDDAPAATNYPIATLTKTGDSAVHYLRTSGFSTLGVATGNAIHSTNVQVPGNVPPGQYQLVIIANGIASNPVNVQVST